MRQSSRTTCKPVFLTIKRVAHLSDHERLDLARVRDVRADAQVDHGATAVDRGRLAVGDLRLDQVLLILVVLYNA